MKTQRSIGPWVMAGAVLCAAAGPLQAIQSLGEPGRNTSATQSRERTLIGRLENMDNEWLRTSVGDYRRAGVQVIHRRGYQPEGEAASGPNIQLRFRGSRLYQATIY